MRPLPQLTPANEWFWTSGADGRLRIQQCQDCKALVHPPVPVCPACRSRSEPTAVSGRGTVVAFTVNRHRWLPGFEPPYVIANVALAEDPTVHLTTNVVGCDPDEVHIGQEVMVRFEPADDVWLPLFGGGRVSGPSQEWRAPFGAMSAAHWIGMNANHYLHRYGATRQMLGWIALNGRANAARNPAAIYRDPMTMDDYLAARTITSPFGLYDCDVPCDASIAVVVSDASVAADLPKPAVRVEAVGTQITERISWDQETITHEPQVLGQSAHLWTRTGLRPADVDLALVYDGFTFNAISWIEALGFCGIGEAKDWLDGGRRIALDGELPVNPHGGQLSEGRTHGFGFIYEAMAPLRHEAGERQVPGARTAVVTSGGGTPSGVLLLCRDQA